MSEKAVCKSCGKCCEAIWLGSSLKDIRQAADKGCEDALFIVKHWKPISVKEARQKNAFYVDKIVTVYIEKKLFSPGTWFSCRKLNRRSKLCRVHRYKPRICAAYPFYGKGTTTEAVLFSMDCGYRVAQTEKAKELQECWSVIHTTRSITRKG